MTINDLNSRLTQALKNYIKTTSHSNTGRLYNSIKFTCTDAGELDIKFTAMDYVNYLDDGRFITNFLALPTTINIITEYLSRTIELGIE